MPFRNPVVAAGKLVRDFIESSNFASGISGWIINRDGTAEFNDVTVRGMITAGNDAESHLILDPDVAVAFNNGLLEAVIRMFPDDPMFMMEGMLGVVTFDALQADAQMSAVIHSPIGTRGMALVLAADADDMSMPSAAGIGTVTVDGDAMTFVPVFIVETYGVSSPVYLAYGTAAAGQTVEAFGSPGIVPWVCPAGVTTVKAECWGGGGAGGAPATVGGGGGGGGEYASQTVAVTPGLTYNLSVGAGSTGAGAGQDSTFPGDAVTVRGHGGLTSNSGAGAVGGSGSVNTVHHNGGRGADGNATTNGGGGGGGGGTTGAGVSAIDSNGAAGGTTGGGAGGRGGSNTGRAGVTGGAPAGGGGGIGAGTISPSAGNGGSGTVRLTYIIPSTGIVASVAGDSGMDRFGNAFPEGITQNNHQVLDNSRVRKYSMTQTANLALAAGGYANMLGMSLAFTTLADNAEVSVIATMDTNITTAGAIGDLAIYQLLLDGVAVSTQTPYLDLRLIRRELVPGVWNFTVPLAGNHTLQMQGRKNAGTAGVSAQLLLTTADVMVVDNHGGA